MMMKQRILIVDDDTTFALMLRTWLSKQGFEVETASKIAGAKERLSKESYSLVLSDMRLPDEDGIALLQWMAGQEITTPVIVMTSYAEIQNAVRSMKLGARDYVAKPVNPTELLAKIREALVAVEERTQQGGQIAIGMRTSGAVGGRSSAGGTGVGEESSAAKKKSADQTPPLNYIEGRSDLSRRLYEYIRLVAPTNMSVLVHGASGTGKEHVAQLIHRCSKRRDEPFVAVDCGAISKELAASEFFGHVKGSFTGALSDKRGAFEAANGGTLFLDEVGNLTYETQVQLLRALQERRIRPVGSNREIQVDIRLVTATNEDLEGAIAKGTFRGDLYHRINEFTLKMPLLRETPEDVLLYADFFLDQANRALDKHLIGFDASASEALMRCSWSGNLRQLKNAVMTATLLATGDFITVGDLPVEVADEGERSLEIQQPMSNEGVMTLRNPVSEEEQIRRALAQTGGNKSQAARLLGIDRKTLYNKMHLYGME